MAENATADDSDGGPRDADGGPRDADGGAWDAIVVGSGMGGMAAAAALVRVGHRVLVLERHTTAGGLTHDFSRDGFSWDVGIHYLSGLAPGERERDILDWLTDAPIEFAPLGSVYDNLHIGRAPPLQLSRPFEAQEMDLKDRFPEEADAIEAWTRALREGQDAMGRVIPTRAMPEAMGNALRWWNRRAIEKWCGRTTDEVVADITSNPDLAKVLVAQWGDHGGRPSKASFAMHATISGSYLNCGSWYPVGGAGAFAEHIVPTIEGAGGEVRTGVRVDGIVLEDDRAVGVRTHDGRTIRAKAVVSDIGARETVDALLPPDCPRGDWVDAIRALEPSIAHFTLFLGLEGDIEKAGATRSNHWIYPTGEVDAVWTDAPDGAPPHLFVSFGSLKDPAHDPGPRQRHTGQVVAWTDWSTVERWDETGAGERGEGYADFKARVEATMFAQFERYFPELAKLVVLRELATPLTTVDYTGHHRGAFYGIDVTPERVASDALQARTPIEGLFLAGQDVVTPGIPGALWGGLLAAASIDRKVLAHVQG